MHWEEEQLDVSVSRFRVVLLVCVRYISTPDCVFEAFRDVSDSHSSGVC
jgi:hypothetical protein